MVPQVITKKGAEKRYEEEARVPNTNSTRELRFCGLLV